MNKSSAPKKEFTVAVVGGGIGGLTLAIGLLRRNVSVQVYEAASAFREVGLGLSIGPAAHRTMPLVDPRIREIYDSLVTTHADSPGYEKYRQTWFEFVWGTGEKAGQVLLDLKALPSGQTTVRRSDFLDSLVSLIPPEIAHFGKRLEKVTETKSRVKMLFDDGTTASADFVIGCDGIHSKVKQHVVPKEYEQTLPRYSGMYGHRAILDTEVLAEAVGQHRAKVATIYIGQGAYAITYPIMRAKKVNVGLYTLNPKWDSENLVRPASKSDMRRDMNHMGKYVNAIMDKIEDASQWAIFETGHISTYARSRVAILGDAAHASTPHQGAGAGQAIEDAHVLADLLGDPHVTQAEHVVAAFHAYDAVRRPRSQQVVTTSRDAADLLCLSLEGIMDDEEKLKESLQERFRWLWDLNTEQQVERAREIMRQNMNPSMRAHIANNGNV